MELRAMGASRAIKDTAGSLAIDLVTAEVVAALRDRGVSSILLKGPTFAEWLYAGGGFRPYGDIDILISQADVLRAEAVLQGLGFGYGLEPPGGRKETAPALPWLRGKAAVELHTTLAGAETNPTHVWDVLSSMTEGQRVGGLDLNVLDPCARAMHVALHAARHGAAETKPLDDLLRALEMLPFDTWEAAALLSERLNAQAAFAAGLRLLPAGRATADRLRLDTRTPIKVALQVNSPPPLALGLEELRLAHGLKAKLSFLGRKLIPSPAFMRYVSPLARRGTAGLTLAYCVRLAWLTRHLPAAVRAWARTRREVS